MNSSLRSNKSYTISSVQCYAYLLSFLPDEVCHGLWSRRIEAHHVKHSRVFRVSDREPSRGHGVDDELRVDASLLSVLRQSLGRMDLTAPSLAVSEDVEGVELPEVPHRPHHRQRTVCGREIQTAHR